MEKGIKLMVIVLFEVILNEGRKEDYLQIASELKEHLEKSPGFIRAERFSSIVEERKLLSMSVWENEEAVQKWRNLEVHRYSQALGRDAIFESYRITVTKTIRSYTEKDRLEAPTDSNQYFKV